MHHNKKNYNQKGIGVSSQARTAFPVLHLSLTLFRRLWAPVILRVTLNTFG